MPYFLLPLYNHHWGRDWRLAWWHHPPLHIHPFYPVPPSSFSPSPFSCLFPSTSQSVGCSPHWLLSFSPVKMHHNPSQPTPIYSSTGVFSSSYPNMLWRCFSSPALSEYSVYRFIRPLPQDWKSIVVRGKAPLDPPYLPPSGQGSLSQLRTGKRERERGEKLRRVFVSSSCPDTRTAAAHHQFEKRHLSDGTGISAVCVCRGLCSPMCVFDGFCCV